MKIVIYLDGVRGVTQEKTAGKIKPHLGQAISMIENVVKTQIVNHPSIRDDISMYALTVEDI